MSKPPSRSNPSDARGRSSLELPSHLHLSGALKVTPTDIAPYRTLFTKSFDGPSGHKAKRQRGRSAAAAGGPLSGVDVPAFDDDSEDEDEDDARDWEHWEDRCDDIADLMGQQRHTLLWSAAW